MQWCFIEAFPTFSSVEVVLQCVWEQSLDTELGFHGFLRLLRALTPLSTSSVSGLDNPSRVCLRVCLETDLFPFSLLLPPCSKLHSLSWSVWLWLPSHCCLVWIHMAAEVIILKQKMSHCWMKYSTGFIQSASLKKSQRSIVTCRAFFFFFSSNKYFCGCLFFVLSVPGALVPCCSGTFGIHICSTTFAVTTLPEMLPRYLFCSHLQLLDKIHVLGVCVCVWDLFKN